ncbi:MAG: FtsH protease activity modulator HflK [Myxococcota bacterium]|nr:FtsH protease activity modulator HflK [Myxococcota bacterium]
MAPEDQGSSPKVEKIKRGAARTVTNVVLGLVAVGVILGWVGTGFYKLDLGEEAIILRLGENFRTEHKEGWNWHWPEPLEYDKKVNTQGQRTEVFGIRRGDAEGGEREGLLMQTADKNIVSVSFELQYTVSDAYSFEYGMLEPKMILFQAARSAVRQVVGGMTVDEVLIYRKQDVEKMAQTLLIKTLTSYFTAEGDAMAFQVEKINLQEVNPPESVRAAFSEVAAAQQDEERFINQARGQKAEILERSRAEAAELREGSEAYKEAKVLEARGQGQRFSALLAEYQRAPEVTRRRLYIETMEQVLPGVEKVIVEGDAAQVLPFVPVPSNRGASGVMSGGGRP